MNLVLFFEGTGQGVAGAYTNVTRLRDLCVEDESQRLHLEPGPGAHFGAYAVGALHGIGWRQIFARARRWFEQNYSFHSSAMSQCRESDARSAGGREGETRSEGGRESDARSEGEKRRPRRLSETIGRVSATTISCGEEVHGAAFCKSGEDAASPLVPKPIYLRPGDSSLSLPTSEPVLYTSPKIFLFGFSRGALIARHFAEWLEPQGFEVAYLGLWDTVDSTINLDVSETCPSNVRAARHAVARDETRRFYALVPLLSSRASRTSHTSHTSQTCSQLVFPGSHSDVGGLYADNHVIADAALDWIAQGAVKAGLRLKQGVRLRHPRDFSLAILHSEQGEATNLWGAFDPVQRVLKGLRRHVSCRACGRDCPNRVR